jgi:replicative DNA helicase
MAVRAAREDCAVYVTFENSPQNLTRKAIAARANLNPAHIVRGVADLAQFEEAAIEWGREAARLTIIPGRANLTVEDVRAEVEQTMKRTGASRCLVVADYLQTWAKGTEEFRTAYSNVRDRVEALAIALRQDLAMALNSPVLALASQSRSKSANDDESYGSTSLDSLKESGDLEYGADVVLILTRSKKRVLAERTARPIDLTIRKNRDGEADTEAPLIFRPDQATFREAADNE